MLPMKHIQKTRNIKSQFYRHPRFTEGGMDFTTAEHRCTRAPYELFPLLESLWL